MTRDRGLMTEAIRFGICTGETARRPEDLLSFCHATFEQFSDAYLTERLSHIAQPCLITARLADDSLAGFKLGYRRGPSTFYSWLGGVHPDCRRRGIARELMNRQHDWARSQGYEFIETRTRAANNAMLVINLSAGFRICGFETDRGGHEVVSQRLRL